MGTSPIIKPTFYPIKNNYNSLKDLQKGLKQAGLESSDLIIGIDFTKSNIYNGLHSYQSKSLHHIYNELRNPYQLVLYLICKTLSVFDDDHMIPCYGFGDVLTRDKKLFSFKDNDEPCYGLEEVQSRYAALAKTVSLAGPTSFGPLIRQALRIVVKNDFRYHILLIVADGQISEIAMKDSLSAIVQASHYPLSIVMIGVGDGPWHMMKKFDDELPVRKFDNFQFVSLNATLAAARKEKVNEKVHFVLEALMEIPEQYQLIKRLKLMSPNCLQAMIKKRLLRAVTVLRPPNEMDAALHGSTANMSTQLDIPISGFDPVYVLDRPMPSRCISRTQSSPNVTNSAKVSLNRTRSSDQLRRQSSGRIVIHEKPISRQPSNDPEYVDNLVKQAENLSKFVLF